MILVDNGSALLEEAQRAIELKKTERELLVCDRAEQRIERVRIALDTIRQGTPNTVELQMASALMGQVRHDLGDTTLIAQEGAMDGSLGTFVKDALVSTGRLIARLIKQLWDFVRRMAGRMSASSSKLGKTQKYFDQVVSDGRKTISAEAHLKEGTPTTAKFTRLLRDEKTVFSLKDVEDELEKSVKFIKAILNETGTITDKIASLRSDQKEEFILGELALSTDRYVKSCPDNGTDDVGKFSGYIPSLHTGYGIKLYHEPIAREAEIHLSAFTSFRTTEVFIGPEGRAASLSADVHASDFAESKKILRLCSDMNSVEVPTINAILSKLERWSEKTLAELNKAVVGDDEKIRAAYMACRFLLNNYVKALTTVVKHVDSVVEDVDAAMTVFCHLAR